ncbi:hypothetical protein PEBR_29495 [Penicillium brasilianum]|uniref:Uncharacterized protein n=1 Tax=Penicillium brasilianum TaxID=104259 RepID=A0A1S9RGW7_PENBI|nr:hypothetical protein PEBR_29495 [Penicillium brasilianum]
MDSIKTKDVPQTPKDTKPMTSVEEYQRRWAQLMDDTAKQIQKIRGSTKADSLFPCFFLLDEEQARKSSPA